MASVRHRPCMLALCEDCEEPPIGRWDSPLPCIRAGPVTCCGGRDGVPVPSQGPSSLVGFCSPGTWEVPQGQAPAGLRRGQGWPGGGHSCPSCAILIRHSLPTPEWERAQPGSAEPPPALQLTTDTWVRPSGTECPADPEAHEREELLLVHGKAHWPRTPGLEEDSMGRV